jgi:hypothetical protein
MSETPILQNIPEQRECNPIFVALFVVIKEFEPGNKVGDFGYIDIDSKWR